MQVYSKCPGTRNGWGCKWDSFLPYCTSCLTSTDKCCKVSCVRAEHFWLQKSRWFTVSCRLPLPPGRAHVELQVKQICIWKPAAGVLFVSLHVRACPLTLAQIAGAAFPARKDSRGRREGVGVRWRHWNSWWGVWCSPCSICTPPVSGQVGITRHTRLHTQTSCHPWHQHTLGCAITAGVFPDLVFVAIWEIPCPRLPFFTLCLYSTEVSWWSPEASRGLLSRKIDLQHINILHLSSLSNAGLLEGKSLLVACCVEKACILALACMSFSHVFVLRTAPTPTLQPPPQPRRQTQGEVLLRALTARLRKGRMWRWRMWFEFDWFMAVTPFCWVMRSCEPFRGRPEQNTFRFFARIPECELFWHALS